MVKEEHKYPLAICRWDTAQERREICMEYVNISALAAGLRYGVRTTPGATILLMMACAAARFVSLVETKDAGTTEVNLKTMQQTLVLGLPSFGAVRSW